VLQLEGILRSQGEGLTETARLAGSGAEGAALLHAELDSADERLGAALGPQIRALAGQEADVAAQRQRLAALVEAQQEWWAGLSAAVGRGPRRAAEIAAAARERLAALVGDGAVVAEEGGAARSAKGGHCAAQEALVTVVNNATAELQVGY
jgi:hypothetical protein